MNNKLPEKIIEEIRKQGIEPRPRWYFLLKRSVLWSLAGLSIVLGGIAVAVIIFIFIDHDANARAYLNESIFEDLLQTIPYLWLATLLLLVGITQYAVRHTKFGYRYGTKRIIGLVLVCSIALGIALSVFEVGERVQDFLVTRVPYYDELISTSRDIWSRPERGLLGGTIDVIIDTEEIRLTDFRGKSWLVDIGEIDTVDDSIIQSGSMIKIIGTAEDAAGFRAVRILPWN
jgi:hypothetical protein